MTNTAATADRLLDAQVAWLIDQLSGETLLGLLARDVDELLAAAADITLAELLQPTTATAVIELLLTRVPGSPVVIDMVEAVADQVHAGPSAAVTPAELIDRADVKALVDAARPLLPLVAEALDRSAASPQVGTLASGFVSKIVVGVLEANKAITKKIPGVRSVVSMGTNAATKMVGAADKQVQAMLGDSAGKGTTAVVRRLNTVVMSTLEDPAVSKAVVEVFDSIKNDKIESIAGVVAVDDVRRFASVLQGIVTAGATTAPVKAFIASAVEVLVERHGETSVATFVDDLGLTRDDLVAIATLAVPPLLAVANAHGLIEKVARERLAPFFASDAVAAILA